MSTVRRICLRDDRALAESVRRERDRLGLPPNSTLAEIIVEHRVLAAAALLKALGALREPGRTYLDVYGPDGEE